MHTHEDPSAEGRSAILSDWDHTELITTLVRLDELLELKNISKRHQEAIVMCRDAVWEEYWMRPPSRRGDVVVDAIDGTSGS